MLSGEVVEAFRNEPFLEKVWPPACDTIPSKTWTNISLPERVDRKTVANQNDNTTKVKLGEPIYLTGLLTELLVGECFQDDRRLEGNHRTPSTRDSSCKLNP